MKYLQQNKNTSTSLLLKRFTDKQSGKVGEARREIQHRFDYLDWNVQKRILLYFLDSGKSDRMWAYAKLLKFWDDCFEPIVRSHWEQYHEDKCAWPIIRFFPESYVWEHLEELSSGENYYHICLRLGINEEFTIDKTKLTPEKYLSVLHRTGRRINEDEAHSLLYQLIKGLCFRGLSLRDTRYMSCHDRSKAPYPYDIPTIRQFIYDLNDLGVNKILHVFTSWANKIQTEISNSPEYHNLQSLSLPDDVYLRLLAEITLDYTKRALHMFAPLTETKLRILKRRHTNSDLK